MDPFEEWLNNYERKERQKNKPFPQWCEEFSLWWHANKDELMADLMARVREDVSLRFTLDPSYDWTLRQRAGVWLIRLGIRVGAIDWITEKDFEEAWEDKP